MTTADQAEVFWKQVGTRFLSGASLVSDLEYLSGSVDLVQRPIGPVRVALGAVLSTSRSDTTPSPSRDSVDTQNEAAARLLQGGGTIHGTGSWPLYYGYGPTSHAAVILHGAAAIDVPTGGTSRGGDAGFTGSLTLAASARAFSRDTALGVEAELVAKGMAFTEPVATNLRYGGNGAYSVSLRAGFVLNGSTSIGVVWTPVQGLGFEDAAPTWGVYVSR